MTVTVGSEQERCADLCLPFSVGSEREGAHFSALSPGEGGIHNQLTALGYCLGGWGLTIFFPHASSQDILVYISIKLVATTIQDSAFCIFLLMEPLLTTRRGWAPGGPSETSPP